MTREGAFLLLDREIWYDWLFFYFLGTISATLKLLEKADADEIPF